MRIGCLQFAPQVGDVDNNLNRADSVLDRADPEDLDLLVLPELAFTGQWAGSLGFSFCVLFVSSFPDLSAWVLRGRLFSAAALQNQFVGSVGGGANPSEEPTDTTNSPFAYGFHTSDSAHTSCTYSVSILIVPVILFPEPDSDANIHRLQATISSRFAISRLTWSKLTLASALCGCAQRLSSMIAPSSPAILRRST